MTFKFQIKARFTDAVVFEAELASEYESASESRKLGEAVRLAVKSDAYLGGADLGGANLARANLAGADLGGANLARANLAGADLAGANLAGAYLGGADLGGAYLARANLAGADLAGAYLGGADLGGANLARANLAGADLGGANLARANLAGADLADADLAGAKIQALITRVWRMIDPHEFIAFATDRGVIIRAGCRTKSPAEFRAHVAKHYPDTPKAAETLTIIDFIEARAAAIASAETEVA